MRGEFRPGGAEREWCDPEVLRLLRRRSLARLRREVEPVDPAALGRFLPDWQGVAPAGPSRPPLRGTAGLERLAEVVDQLAGLPIPASVLERDVLPARIPGYQPRLLDELGALGEVAWVGRGSLGRDDGRIALVRPGREVLRPAGSPDGARTTGRTPARRDPRAPRGARRVVLSRAVRGGARATSDREVLDALWDLVWAGEVTNDTFAPLRALRWKRTGSSARRANGRPGRLTALGPPEAAGRWSLVAPLVATSTERLHAQSLALLERHGVLTREAVASEGIEGGFAAVYPVLRAMEDAGRIRRGYFVDGLGAAQFALAGALDRLRAVREPADPRERRRGPPAGRRRSGQPVRRGAALAASRRDRSPAAPARGGRLRRPRRRGRGALPRARRGDAPDAPGRRRSRPSAVDRGPRAAARSSPTAASASWSSARSMARTSRDRRSASRPARGRLRGRLSRPGPRPQRGPAT